MSVLARIADGTRATPAEAAESSRTPAVIEAVEANGEALFRYFIRRVEHREDAADLLGETLLVVWKKASRLPADEEEARMWMFGIARRVLSTHRRGQGRRHALADRLREELMTTTSVAGQDGGRQQTNGELHEFVRSLIRDLDPRDQEIVTLVHWERMPLVDVARLIGMKQSTVRTRYARARASLRLALSESGDISSIGG